MILRSLAHEVVGKKLQVIVAWATPHMAGGYPQSVQMGMGVLEL